MFTAIQLAFAGATQYILHWGLFASLAVALAAAGYFTTAVPIIGPYLKDMREHLLWAAFGCVLVMVGMYIGGRDAARRCEAKQIIIEKVVTKAVTKTSTPKAKAQQDRWDREEY